VLPVARIGPHHIARRQRHRQRAPGAAVGEQPAQVGGQIVVLPAGAREVFRRLKVVIVHLGRSGAHHLSRIFDAAEMVML
jgi:hypothetical protein